LDPLAHRPSPLPTPAADLPPAERALGREAALAEIWSEVLRLPQVGLDDDFLALGGHSLHATQVLSRVRDRFGATLPLRALFESPTPRALAARAEWHPEQKLEWHPERRTKRRTDPGATMPAVERIHRVPRDAPLRTSYSQRRMWLVQQLNPQTTAYNMAFTLRLRGALDCDRLAAALDTVARRHEAFRTRFIAVDGEPAQVIGAHPVVALEQIDLGNHAAAAREGETRQALRNAARQRFDLTAGGLHRTLLVRLDETDHVLLWLIHHSVGDQWSAGVLMHELQQAYTALIHGQPADLPTRRIEFADYAEWQRDAAREAALEPQLAYWRRQLDGVAPLALPTDKPRRGQISGSGGSATLDLGVDRLSALKGFSSRHRVTPFMTLLACFQLVLARRSGQTDIAVGVPVANRHSTDAEALVGTLVNTVVMRSRVVAELRFLDLLAAVKETALQAYANQDAPFDTLVQQLAVRRDRNFSPLVQVMFNVLNAPYRVDGFAGLHVQPFPFDQGAAQFDLSLTVDTETFGQAHLEYASDLFDAATARRMLAGYVAVLDQVLADPSLTLADYALLGREERAELQRWNATEVIFERGAPKADATESGIPAGGLRLGDLIRRGVATHGDAIAVVFEGRHVTYRELDASARALALRLRAAGAGPGTLVGVCLERSVELVTALVGVVYSGAAYVPLDPAYPAERLANMCGDAAMTLIVARDLELHRLRPALPVELCVIDIDTVSAAGDADGAGNERAEQEFSVPGSADDPAYVIFTSGSTGRPKGAMNAHKGVVNWLRWMQSEYHLTPQDRVLLKTPYSFDVSLREFFWPLMVGATIVVARPDGHRDSAYLVETIRAERITLLHFVPSMLRIFLDEPGLDGCTSIRRVVCSGEALPADAVAMFFERLPHSRLCNLYGPTEAAVEVTYWECRPEHGNADAANPASVPIGRPVANTQMHVLDDRLRPQPVGVPGELYIGGVQVGMGYVARPELTAERFLADPFVPGARLYKTGDLARWTHDGVIDYLGRTDHQVKVRGHRIELGEIEACLATHAEVAQCVVVAREDTPGDKRLVAYVTACDSIPAVGALREHLRRQVPEYMVPQHVVVLDSIPLLANGKIDRNALPAPTDNAVQRDTAFWVPRTDAEVALAQIWEHLLDIDRVSTTDNFFDLGGHSLLAMRVVSDIHKALGVRIAARRLVYESLGQLAASVEANLNGPADEAPAVKATTARYLMNGLKRMLAGRGRPGAGVADT
jgi:amino acid adenylation domain-containing protein